MKNYEYQEMREADAAALRKKISQVLATVNDWEQGYAKTEELRRAIWDVYIQVDNIYIEEN